MVQGAVIYLLMEPLLDTAAVPEAQSGAGHWTGDFLRLSAIGFRPRLPKNTFKKKIPKCEISSLASSKRR